MASNTLPLVIDLARVQETAVKRKNDTEAFRYFVERMWEAEHRTAPELDAIVEDIAARIIPAIDCTTCGNCCRSLQVGLTPDDIPLLAKRLHTTTEIATCELVDDAAARRIGEWGIFGSIPCTFLNGNLCTIYDVRPQSCRAYPKFTPDFLWLMEPIFAGANMCPIIFNVIEQLKEELGW